MTSATTLAVTLVRAWTRAYTCGIPPMWAEQRRAEIESDLFELQHDPLCRLATNPRHRGERIEVVIQDGELQLGHRMGGRDRQRQPRTDLADRHQQLEEPELVERGEAKERLLIFSDQMVGEDRCLAPRPEPGEQ